MQAARVAELTFAAHLRRTRRANVNSKSNTRINHLLVFLMVQAFALRRADDGGKYLNRNTGVGLFVGDGRQQLALTSVPMGMSDLVTPDKMQIHRCSIGGGD